MQAEHRQTRTAQARYVPERAGLASEMRREGCCHGQTQSMYRWVGDERGELVLELELEQVALGAMAQLQSLRLAFFSAPAASSGALKMAEGKHCDDKAPRTQIENALKPATALPTQRIQRTKIPPQSRRTEMVGTVQAQLSSHR
ncbi:unnamed protein product [Nippostrongylus brasiliensis]|uniref:Uncharacterized protein n=1 Tax=Nippostrongylus brasiliensis TaxID=27835 RepID=A0A0N4XW68_NIPBR|nr:unnamed protein product [Nippostrongylus brasiliensis]